MSERCDRECTPRDSVDALLESWTRQRPDLDTSPVAVVQRLGRVQGHLDDQASAILGTFGVSAPAFSVLVTLERLCPCGPVSQRLLADELGLTPGTVSVRIDRLVDEGLVVRRPDPGSKRNVLLELTERGREVFERIAPAHLANEDRLLAALDEDERELLGGLLRKLLVEFEGSTGPADGTERLGLYLTPAHVTIEMRESVGLPRVPGLLVRAVDAGSPAAEAGISAGDVLVAAGGRELRSSSSLYAAIEDAGDELALDLLRGNEEIATTLRLAQDRAITGRAASAPSIRPGEHCV
jgi:DNA-binding MarR family transcriptional regulator